MDLQATSVERKQISLAKILRAVWAYPLFVCLVLLMYPLITIGAFAVGRTRYRKHFLYTCTSIYLWFARLAFGVRLEVSGTPPASGVVLACNHESTVDSVALCCATPNTLFLFRDSVHIATLLRQIGMIPVYNNKNWLQDCAAVDLEYNIAIFPEGARMAPGVVVPYRRGVAVIASATQRPICLACINSGAYWGRRMIPRLEALGTTIKLQFLQQVPHDTPLDVIESQIRAGRAMLDQLDHLPARTRTQSSR